MTEIRNIPQYRIIALLAILITATLSRAQQTQNLTLRGTITHANNQTYVEVPFNVPANTARVAIEFSYTGREQHTTIDLGLFDPERFRGWSGGNKHAFTVSESDATPSYLPGPMPPGIWKLILGVPNIRAGVTSTYVAHIHLTRAGEIPSVSTFSSKPLRVGPAWYRGDLHMHDAHSDGSCTSQSGVKVPCPLYKTVEAAVAQGLDFIAISDHNTTSHFDAMQELQPYFDRTLLIPAREITTFQGHANVFGPTGFIDFRLTSPTVPDLNHLLDAVEAAHGIFSINHPSQPTGEACMGCGWSVPNTDYHRIPVIEAINGNNAESRIAGIPFWQQRLNEGHRITAIGGSDNHDATSLSIGHPTTAVYAADLSQNAILDAIRAGHVFIDTEGSKDRGIDFTATTSTAKASMGDTLTVAAKQSVQFTLTAHHLQGTHAEVIEDGAVTTLLPATPAASEEQTSTFTLIADGGRHWVRINIRAPSGKLLLAGNPIYLNF
jgi:hypothetical protein